MFPLFFANIILTLHSKANIYAIREFNKIKKINIPDGLFVV